MTDIIERLRKPASYPSWVAADVLCAEAADEIERLRGEVATLEVKVADVLRDCAEMRQRAEEAENSLWVYMQKCSMVEAERDAAVKMLGYVRLPAQRALGRVNWIRPADEPPPNVMVNWYTNADTLTELLKMTEGTP